MSATPVEKPADELDTEPLPEEKPAEPSPEDLKREAAELKRELEAEKRLNTELKARDEFWAKRQEKPKPAAKAQPTPEPDPIEELDILTLLTEEKDPAKISKTLSRTINKQVEALLKRGDFISRKEAEEYTSRIIEGATATNRLVQEFPQLADPKSEFFAETQKQIGVMGDDPAYQGMPETALYRMAALAAEVSLGRAGKLSKGESEEDRIERIMAQKGLSGGRGSSDDSDTGLSAAERRALAAFNASGHEISEADWKKYRKQAVTGPRLTAMRGA